MKYAAAIESGTSNGPQALQQLVLFGLGGRQFGVDVGCVREIRGWQTTTELPGSKCFILGVINLRGNVVEVLDLQARLGFGANSNVVAGVVIVVELEDQLVGLLADCVSDIVTVGVGDLRSVPETAESICTLLRGIAIRGDEIIGLLDLQAVLRATTTLALAA